VLDLTAAPRETHEESQNQKGEGSYNREPKAIITKRHTTNTGFVGEKERSTDSSTLGTHVVILSPIDGRKLEGAFAALGGVDTEAQRRSGRRQRRLRIARSRGEALTATRTNPRCANTMLSMEVTAPSIQRDESKKVEGPRQAFE